MEKAAERSEIIEFNGLPGAGKSTITSRLKEMAILNNWKVVESFNQSFFNKKPVTVFLCPFCLSFLPLISRLKNNWWYKKDVLGQVVRFLNYARSYRNYIIMQPSSTLYILDEGIIQSLVSILFIDAIGGKQHIIRQIFNKLYKNGITWHQVDLDSDIQLSFNRVLERKSNLGRMDFMEEEELQKALAIQKETFSQIRILASDTGVAKNNLTVPSNDNVEHCANKIFDWINN